MQRNRARRRDAAFYRDLLVFCGVPPAPPRGHRRVEQPRPVVNQLIVLSFDTSAEEIVLPGREQQSIVLDLDSSLESLPNIDPRPQHQLPDQPLVDLGHLDVTYELQPPLQHQCLREAYVLLMHLQVPPLQPVTPPPELPQQHQTPPLDQEGWVVLEAAVANFDGKQQVVFAPPPLCCNSQRWYPSRSSCQQPSRPHSPCSRWTGQLSRTLCSL